jgi:hypothetical protein
MRKEYPPQAVKQKSKSVVCSDADWLALKLHLTQRRMSISEWLRRQIRKELGKP